MKHNLYALAAAAVVATAAITAAADVPETAGHISATITARNAGTAQWFFAMAPDNVLPLLPANTRLDMLDYFNSGIARESADASGARAIVTGSTARTLRFETGDTTRFELAVFTPGSDTIVALIETVTYPMPDSRIAWYDSRWRPVRAPFAEPQLADWLTKEGRRHRAEVEEQLPFISAVATADPDRGTVTYTRTIDSYFPAPDRPAALLHLSPTLTRRLK